MSVAGIHQLDFEGHEMKRILTLSFALSAYCAFGQFSVQRSGFEDGSAVASGGGSGPTHSSISVSNYTTGTAVGSYVVKTVSVGNGSRLVLSFSNEQANNKATAIVSVPVITWTKRTESAAGATSGSCEIWDATTASSGSFTITVSVPNTSSTHGSCTVDEWTGQETTPSGAAPAGGTPGTTMSQAITTTRASSVINSVASDWNQADAARTYRTQSGLTSNNETLYSSPAGAFTAVHFYSVVTTVQAYTIGFTTPADASSGWGVCSYEVRTP